MAQRIQFIYLTQSDYDNLTPQTSRIYFTSDTHRIYKGSDLYAATTFDQLKFSSIEASNILVDGQAVALEGHEHSVADIDGLATAIAAASNFASIGHTHSVSDIQGLAPVISAVTSGFASLGHTHSISDIASLSSILTGITSSSLTKDVVNASTVSASTITANVGEFDTLYVNGDADFEVNNVDANAVTVNGTSVALEGHTHSVADISDFASAISLATSDFASASHTHVIGDIQSLTAKVSGLTSSKVEKTNGVFTNLSTTNLVVSSATIDAISIEASSITVNGSAVSLEGHSHSMSDIEDYEDNTFWITGTANPATLEVQVDQDFEDAVEAADAGKHIRMKLVWFGESVVCPWANVIYNSNGSAVGFDFHIMLDTVMLNPDNNSHPYLISVHWDSSGFDVRPYELSETNHDHDDVYASISHSHAISDVTDLSTILSGITSSSVEKDTVAADIGYFRLLSVSGSANFAVNTVSANAVSINGTPVSLEGHTHSIYAASDHNHDGIYASVSHSHDMSDITGLENTLSAFASSGHSHVELAGITSSTISKNSGDFVTLSASTATFETMTVSGSATFDITNLVADAITVSDLNLTGTLSVSSTAISAMTVTDMSVTGTLTLNNKSIATEEYVLAQISAAIGQILASAY